MWRRGTYPQVLITSNPASQHTCFTSSPYSSAAATPAEWHFAPATRVTLLLPGKECERDKKCQKHNMSPPASPNHSTQTNVYIELSQKDKSFQKDKFITFPSYLLQEN